MSKIYSDVRCVRKVGLSNAVDRECGEGVGWPSCNRLIFRLGGRRVLKTSLLLHALLTRRSVSDVVHRLGRRLLRDASAMRLLFTNFTFFPHYFSTVHLCFHLAPSERTWLICIPYLERISFAYQLSITGECLFKAKNIATIATDLTFTLNVN